MHPGYDDDAMNAFLAQVQVHGDIITLADADQAARATLSTLAQALSAGKRQDLAASLPAPLRGELTAGRQQASSLDNPEFLDRVGGLLDTVDPDIVHARVVAVLAALADWASADQLVDTREQLPNDLADLLPSTGR